MVRDPVAITRRRFLGTVGAGVAAVVLAAWTTCGRRLVDKHVFPG